jgi:hypothetical protein
MSELIQPGAELIISGPLPALHIKLSYIVAPLIETIGRPTSSLWE